MLADVPTSWTYMTSAQRVAFVEEKRQRVDDRDELLAELTAAGVPEDEARDAMALAEQIPVPARGVALVGLAVVGLGLGLLAGLWSVACFLGGPHSTTTGEGAIAFGCFFGVASLALLAGSVSAGRRGFAVVRGEVRGFPVTPIEREASACAAATAPPPPNSVPESERALSHFRRRPFR